ncbi:hypothetical protein K438DRAFT_1727497 [Mycena galopus ATCC 62051]|nr:hypothetical protein K438DRAFT_1727497 [Mycena galopus ATCC 62051]
MFSRLWSSPHVPPPADLRCIPCSGIDVGMRQVGYTTGLIINARLDAKKLEQSLTMLVERKFPRAGARLAHRNGVYEFQVPRTFDSTTRAIAFTSEDFAEPYRSVARPELPTDLVRGFTSQPAVLPLPPSEGYFKSTTCPSSLRGFLAPNMPLIHVHVAIFNDVTFIGVTSTHITFDALGTRTLLHAWTRLINGEDIDAISGMEWDMAPFEALSGPTTIKQQRGWFNLGLFGRFFFTLWFMLGIIRDPKEEQRLVRVPKAFIENSKNEIMEDLKHKGSTEWVGSSDVLLAWCLRKVDDTTPIHIHLPINLRDTPIFLGDTNILTPYLNNAVSYIAIPPISVNEFQTESLGELALRLRRAILAYRADVPGIRADVQWRCANPLVDHFPCPPHGECTVQTNWRSAHLGELDFSGARPQGPTEQAEDKTRVVLAVGDAPWSNPMRGVGGMFMEDEDAVWMFQIRGTKEWEMIRQSGSIAFA